MSERLTSLSVIVGAKDAERTIAACLASLTTQTAPATEVEILVVDASRDGTRDLVRGFPAVVLVEQPADRLVPHLWAEGLARARGEIVALTCAEVVPDADWLARIAAAFERLPDAAAVGGPVDGPAGGRARDWALLFARYSAFLAGAHGAAGAAGVDVADVAGDNAAYRTSDLAPLRELTRDGFWETLVDERLRAASRRIVLDPSIRVRVERGAGSFGFALVRFRHGRHYGATRPFGSAGARLLHVLASPLLVPLLALRVARRVNAVRPDWRGKLVLSLPWLLLYLTGWSFGETWGTLTRRT